MEVELPAHIEYWLNQANHDCYFVVGPETGCTERIGALKALLMGYSEPMRSMLGGSDIAEKGDVPIPDVEPDIFKIFLKCIYGATDLMIPNLNFEDSFKLKYVVEKYMIDDIKTKLANHLSGLLNFDNLFTALAYPMLFQEAELQKKIFSLLERDFRNLASNEKFLELSEASIMWILMNNSVFCVREIDIWHAVIIWAMHKTESAGADGIRAQIFGFLRYIRFLAMDFTTFCKDVIPSDILTLEESFAVFHSFGEGISLNIDHLCPIKCPRYMVNNENVSLKIIENDAKKIFFLYQVRNVSDIADRPAGWGQYFEWCGNVWFVVIIKQLERDGTFYCNLILSCRNRAEGSVDITVTLVNQDKKPNYSFTKYYPFEDNQMGACFRFYRWDDLLECDSGFVKNNSFIMMINIKLR